MPAAPIGTMPRHSIFCRREGRRCRAIEASGSGSGQLGLVVTEGSKVPIWKALSINGLRHGVRSNLLIL